MPRLVTTKDGIHQEYELSGEIDIGRSSQCAIRLGSGKASRRHARVFQSGGSWIIEDLGSSNGTRVNGIKINSATLKDGDRIRIGIDEFVFQELIDDPLLGVRVGNYQVLERIGRGGMGTVYRARQVSMDRDVAFKVLKPELARREDLIEDFAREARLAGRLQHPNIVAIYDFGCEGEIYYFSMEFVRGRNLMDEIEKRGVIAPAKVLDYSVMIARALEHAHGQNILHQDIKPRNVMLNEHDEVKLADLGLAKVMAGDNAARTGQPMGTPQYVAPEIVRRQPADARSDIYSLAATMYQMATGLPPYQGSSAEEILRKHLEAPVPDPRLIESEIPDELAQLIIRGLSKEPRDRPANCKELVRLLERARVGARRKPRTAAAAGASPPAAAGRSAVRKAMSDHTDALPKVNPYKPVAIAICSMASVLLAALLAYGIYHLLHRGESSPAAKMLSQAQQLIDAGQAEQARSQLMDLREFYPDSDAAMSAELLLAKLDRQRLAAAATENTPAGTASTPPADNVGSAPAASDVGDGGGAGAQADTKERRAAAAWETILPVVNRDVGEGLYGKAINTLTTFNQSYAGTETAQVAARKLASVRATVDETGKRLLDAARRHRAAGNLGDARKALAAILNRLGDTSWAQQARRELARLNRAAQDQVFALWQRLGPALRSMDPGTAGADASRLAGLLRGLPWSQTATDIAIQAQALAAFSGRLRAAVSRLAPDRKVGVIGLGLAGIKPGAAGKLLARSGDKRETIGWMRVMDDDVWQLAPAWTLDNQARLGGALHFLGRKHYGYMRTYLNYLEREDRAYRRLTQCLWAQRHDRLLLAWFDFSDPAAQRRWQRRDGAWIFHDGLVEGRASEAGRLELTGVSVPMRNLALDFFAHGRGGGQVALVLADAPDRFLAVRLQQGGIVLELVSDGRRQRRRGASVRRGTPLRLVVRGDRAVLSQADRVLAQTQVAGAGNWQARLRLEVIGATGTFKDIAVAVGR